jgi:hypothetical protein
MIILAIPPLIYLQLLKIYLIWSVLVQTAVILPGLTDYASLYERSFDMPLCVDVDKAGGTISICIQASPSQTMPFYLSLYQLYLPACLPTCPKLSYNQPKMCSYHATRYTPCNHTLFSLATFCPAVRTELARINDSVQRRAYPLPFNPPECAPQTATATARNGDRSRSAKGNVRAWEVRSVEECPF